MDLREANPIEVEDDTPVQTLEEIVLGELVSSITCINFCLDNLGDPSSAPAVLRCLQEARNSAMVAETMLEGWIDIDIDIDDTDMGDEE